MTQQMVVHNLAMAHITPIVHRRAAVIPPFEPLLFVLRGTPVVSITTKFFRTATVNSGETLFRLTPVVLQHGRGNRSRTNVSRGHWRGSVGCAG